MGSANQTSLGTELDLFETPWQFSASAYSTASDSFKKGARAQRLKFCHFIGVEQYTSSNI